VRLRSLIFALLLTAPATAQLIHMTQVSAQVKDASGNVFANCQWSIVFVGENVSPGITYSPQALLNAQQGMCDSSGNLSVSLADNINTITPGPSQWSFSICSAAGLVGGPYCKTNMLVTVTGVTQNLTSTFQPLMPLLPQLGINLSAPPAIGNVTPNQGMFSILNHTCVLDGVTNATLAAVLACAGSSGTIEIPAGAATSLAGNLIVPAGVTLSFDGPACITTTGFTFTINGPMVASASKLFCGSGTVTGLSIVRPEWFGSTAINTAVQSAFASTGGTLLLGPGTYTSGFPGLSGGSTCWTQPNVWIKGSGQPFPNGTYAALTGGTMIQGTFAIAGANNVHLTDLGIDNGTTVNGGASINDGLVITGVTGCTTSSPSDPLVSGTYIENVTTLLSGAVAFHSMRIEHNTGAILKNVWPYFGAHGLTLKSIDSMAIGVQAYGQSGDAFIAKSDTYTSTGNIVLSDMKAGPANGLALQAGIILDSEVDVQLSSVSISNVLIKNANYGIRLISNGSVFGAGALTGIGIDRFTYITDSATGLSQHQCITSSGTGSNTITWVHISGASCLNSTALASIPINLQVPVNNSVFENIHTTGANTSSGNVLDGAGFYLNNFTETDDTSTKAFTLLSNATVYVSGYSGKNSLSGSSLGSGAVLNASSSLGTGLAFDSYSSIFFGGNTVTINANSTPTALPGTGAQSGLLRLRDNTGGGSALFLIDPNSGSQLLGTSQITGLASAAGITFSGGVWNVSLSSGTTPRVLAWTIYD
jgi:hypothetical protein